jgi:type I restriction-modification system DNA methylase subunit
MIVQSEQILEEGLIKTLKEVGYEYVSVRKEGIDIYAVMNEIKELEAKRAELDKDIEMYLRELGLVEN